MSRNLAFVDVSRWLFFYKVEKLFCVKLNFSGYDDLFLYESCARNVLGAREWYESTKSGGGRVRLLTQVDGYWARDVWHTRGSWSQDDFMLHSMKEK